ncbi:hypothetical protein BGX27_003473 [Mortierella sp. AM989]|nr:hypothetical protein BGX27_003473 [Mortierella sp. AM989]
MADVVGEIYRYDISDHQIRGCQYRWKGVRRGDILPTSEGELHQFLEGGGTPPAVLWNFIEIQEKKQSQIHCCKEIQKLKEKQESVESVIEGRWRATGTTGNPLVIKRIFEDNVTFSPRKRRVFTTVDDSALLQEEDGNDNDNDDRY